jgi:hypothetical protein
MSKVRFLRSRGCAGDVVPAGGEYGMALQAAAASYTENSNVVTLLLDKGADPNATGASFVILRMYD